MRAADFTNAGKTRPAKLTVYTIVNGRREPSSVHEVSGKREARQIAATLGATCWNF